MTVRVRPISRDKANAWIKAVHRHHKPPQGFKFALEAVAPWGTVGVLTAGRPVGRGLDDGETLEVTRLATSGLPNACSLLYGAAARVAEAMGYSSVVTYTLPEEGGASLRAAGFVLEVQTKGGSWSCELRPREDKHPLDAKWRWRRTLRPRIAKLHPDVDPEVERMLST